MNPEITRPFWCNANVRLNRNGTAKMAGAHEPDQQEEEEEEGEQSDCGFQWDENSQLYFHASSGFYHDPNAGWYYNSRDGHYYKFENGNYVLLETDQGGLSEVYECGNTVVNSFLQDDSCTREPCDKEVNCTPFKGRGYVANEAETSCDEPRADYTECINSELPESLPPPSEWLEDTLIDLYLSNYPNPAMNADSDERMLVEKDSRDSLNLSVDGAINDSALVQEGEWIPDGSNDVDASGSSLEEGSYQDEEAWRSQYGQVTESNKELSPDFPVVDLWDWTMVRGTKKDGTGEVSRLVGRLVKRSVKLHPSMSSNGGLLKTAPICKVRRDLVRVTSGQIYKLRTPSVEHLASLTSYDSSNPTKNWGFAKLSIRKHIQRLPKSFKKLECEIVDGTVHKNVPTKLLHVSPKDNGHAYRDRAAERRALHGSFGVGPGEKKAKFDDDSSSPSSPVSASPETAAAEALNMAFGDGSYAKRIMENMGWKEGEALGSSTKGLTEPLQAIGNKGSAGLGWDHTRKLM